MIQYTFIKNFDTSFVSRDNDEAIRISYLYKETCRVILLVERGQTVYELYLDKLGQVDKPTTRKKLKSVIIGRAAERYGH